MLMKANNNYDHLRFLSNLYVNISYVFFHLDCPKIGVNRYPFDIKQPLKNGCPSLKPGHELQLDAAFVIDDDDDSERDAITFLCNTIKLNDNRATRLIVRLNGLS